MKTYTRRPAMASHYYKVVTEQIIVPPWAQQPGGRLPGGKIDTGYTRTLAEARLIARMDRKQGGNPVITKEARNG